MTKDSLKFIRTSSSLQIESSHDVNRVPRALVLASSDELGTIGFSLTTREVDSVIEWLTAWKESND